MRGSTHLSSVIVEIYVVSYRGKLTEKLRMVHRKLMTRWYWYWVVLVFVTYLFIT